MKKEYKYVVFYSWGQGEGMIGLITGEPIHDYKRLLELKKKISESKRIATENIVITNIIKFPI